MTAIEQFMWTLVGLDLFMLAVVILARSLRPKFTGVR